MKSEIINELMKIRDEEQKILDGHHEIEKSIYTNNREFVVDSNLMLDKGKLIDIRPHTRFLQFPKHKHNYIEIIYMCIGTTTHIIDGEHKIVLEQGDLLFLNKNSIHEVMPASINDIAINFIVLPEFFDVAFRMMDEENAVRDFLIGSLKQTTSDNNYMHFKLKDVIPAQNLIENMVWSLLNKQTDNRQIIQTTMGLLLLELLRNTERMEQQDHNQYERKLVFTVLRQIEENYRNVNLSQLAIEYNQPIYYLSKLVKQNTGQTFKELLQTKRLNQASYFLTSTKLSIADIISAVGYDNTSYFHRVFKERFFVTPKEYREKVTNA